VEFNSVSIILFSNVFGIIVSILLDAGFDCWWYISHLPFTSLSYFSERETSKIVIALPCLIPALYTVYKGFRICKQVRF
jgi:hypothetical protein